MGATPLRASAAEEAATGAAADRAALRAAAEHAVDGTSPPSDLNARSDYREQLARVLTARALAHAAGV
jgi:carbon-monoxide dehydrogenase medium subunit